jgi:DegT/DnrJ/EryC1/StrS aminotransferase family
MTHAPARSTSSSPARGGRFGGRLEGAIETELAARTGRECVFVPSGRLAVHLAFRLLLSPGDRILMSPLEDDTVFFGALAAGLRPVMAPVSAEDGNMRCDSLDDSVWPRVDAVLTGNTYGLPDRVVELSARCAQRGIPLIEDAAHALETDVAGRAIGSFGDASVFSLSKHLPGRGGVLSIGPRVGRAEVDRLLRDLMVARPLDRRVGDVARTAARESLGVLHLRGAVDRALQIAHPVRPAPWRIPLRAAQLEQALSGGLNGFDEWIETAYPDYRMRQRSSALQRTLAALRDLDGDRERRIEGVARLRTLEAVAPAARAGAPLPLLRVPLLVEDRDAVAIELGRRRINVYFVYAPPLDDYAGPEFCEPSPDRAAARWWAAHVLPIDPYDAERVLDLVGRNRIRLAPAPPPAGLA